MDNLIYIPPDSNNQPKKMKIKFKFSNNWILSEYFLKQHNIPYDEKDLEYTPIGKALVIRRD